MTTQLMREQRVICYNAGLAAVALGFDDEGKRHTFLCTSSPTMNGYDHAIIATIARHLSIEVPDPTDMFHGAGPSKDTSREDEVRRKTGRAFAQWLATEWFHHGVHGLCYTCVAGTLTGSLDPTPSTSMAKVVRLAEGVVPAIQHLIPANVAETWRADIAKFRAVAAEHMH